MQTQSVGNRIVPKTVAREMCIWGARYGYLVTVVHFCLFVGCSNTDRANVSGQVKLGAGPLADGLITFRPSPDTAGPEFSAPINDGQYQVAASVLPGNYYVDVRSWQKTGKRVSSPYGGQTDEIVNVVPPRYWDDGTVLTANLKVGDNSVDFNLEQN